MPQSIGKIFVHVIFSTKYREPFIDLKIESRLFDVLSRSITKAGSKPVIVGGYLDHVHLCFNLHRTKTLSKTVEIIKNISSKWIKTKGENYMNFYWQNGYGAFSVNPMDLEIVKSYIRNQSVHHKIMGYKEEATILLQKNGVDFNDQYFWD